MNRHTKIALASFALLSACGPKLKLKGVKATRASVESTVSTISSGTVEAEQQAVLGFTAVGRIHRIAVKAGDKVKKGQILAELDNGDLRTTMADAESEMKRSDELFKEGLVAKSAHDDARRAFEIARANLEKSVARAPFDGLVTETNLQLGELSSAAPTKAPLRLVDGEPRIIKGEIDEIDISKVHQGDQARIKVLAVRTKPFAAEVTKVIPYVGTTREQDRSTHIELKFSEPTDFVPVGATADIEIVVDSKKDALAIPSRAVFHSGGTKHAFKFDDGRIHKVDVKLGIGNYDRSEIIDGLKEGDVVIMPSEDVDLKEGQKAKLDVQAWP